MKKFKEFFPIILVFAIAIIVCAVTAWTKIRVVESLGLPWWAVLFMGE